MVFTVVNVAVLVLRREPVDAGPLPHARRSCRSSAPSPARYLATPFAGRPVVQYKIAGVLLAIGVVLWGVTVLVNRRSGPTAPRLDPERLSGDGPSVPPD